MGRHVTVTGRGTVSAPYDRATLSLAASARAAKPADATTRAAYSIGRVRDAVLGYGITEDALTTAQVSLSPVHDPWPTVVAYEASLGLSVEVTDLSRVGSLLVAAVEAGGDSARIEGVTFGHLDTAVLSRAARERAFADARAKAEQYAGLAGQALGEVRGVAEGAVAGPPAFRLMAAQAAADVPVDAGGGEVSAVVTVSWALGPAV